MKTSFISTILNEEKTIGDFLKSLSSQTKLPDEIIIVDGGSTDKTLSIISNFKFPISNFKILEKKGNRSIGRNEAIRKSKGDIIVSSDAGCILDKNWIKEIIKPYSDENLDVVSGYYLPNTRNAFEKALASYTCVMPDKLDPENFLPSSRSVAFKKSAWKKAGGYPEWLGTCEDLYFARELRRKGFKFAFAGNAIVHWPQRKNLLEAFFQFLSYALGDGTARYFRKTTPYLFARYILGLTLVILFLQTRNSIFIWVLFLGLVLYLVWSIAKNYKYVGNMTAFFYLPLLQLLSDVAVILGMSIGLVRSLNVNKDV